jgi:hypothetical protein
MINIYNIEASQVHIALCLCTNGQNGQRNAYRATHFAAGTVLASGSQTAAGCENVPVEEIDNNACLRPTGFLVECMTP